jgi:hypothetical protein
VPIKSQAQRRKFAELLMKGEISEEVYERWNREAGYKVLPERVKPKVKPKKGAKGKRRTTARKTAGKTRKRRTTSRKATKRSTRSR